MSHKFLYAEISKAASEDGYTFELRGFGGTLPPVLQNGKVGHFVFVQPKMEMPTNGMMTYKKYLVECAVNMLNDLAMNMLPNPLEVNGEQVPGVTEHMIHEDILMRLRDIASTLAYMINSTSWITGASIPYDLLEIKNRLRF